MAFLIDTSIWIQLEKDQRPPRDVQALVPGESIALAAITASEMLVGVDRADTERRRLHRRHNVETILRIAPVEPFDLATARVHAELMAELMSAGTMIGAHDLLISATALAKGYGVLTHNLREFQRIPYLEVRTA